MESVKTLSVYYLTYDLNTFLSKELYLFFIWVNGSSKGWANRLDELTQPARTWSPGPGTPLHPRSPQHTRAGFSHGLHAQDQPLLTASTVSILIRTTPTTPHRSPCTSSYPCLTQWSFQPCTGPWTGHPTASWTSCHPYSVSCCQWPLWCASSTTGALLLQGVCTCCSLSLGRSSPR